MQGWRTIAGAVLTLLIGVGAIFGVTPTPESETPEWVATALLIVSTGFTIWMRFKAKTPAAPQLQRALGRLPE